MSAKKATLSSLSLILLAIAFIALVILSNAFLKGMRIDLTENGLFTLSEGTKNILADIDEPINLYYFFSDQASRNIPTLRTYATRVREMLDEFTLHADGKLNLQAIDPLPFSEAEDRAAQFGLQAVPVGTAGESVYFGLAGTNSVDGVETIRFFQPNKEAFLEYDLTKLVYSLAKPKKPVIGILSTLPMNMGFDPRTGQRTQPWVISTQINQLFEVRNLQPTLSQIDNDVDVLMLVHPKNLSDQAIYAIDQFMVGGGRALIFVDPHAEAEIPQGNPQTAMFAERSSDFKTLLDHWGVNVDSTQVVGDGRYALPVNFNPNKPPVRHLGIASLDHSAMSAEDIITAELSSVNLAMPGHIQLQDKAKVEQTPLLTSSAQAMLIASEKMRFVLDPGDLLKDFSASGERYVIAARLNGQVSTAFPDGRPKQESSDDAAQDAAENPPASPHITESAEPINVILVADTDLLTDRLWVRTNNFFGQQLATAWANNGDFVINALDNLLGNADLISMRSRATSNRPFTTVQQLEREADNRFRTKEQELTAQLQDTEQKLTELQQNRDQADNMMILTAEQRTEIEKFQQLKLEIRKELRQVRRDLDKNIEQLGSWLKFINIGLIPIVLTIAGLITAFVIRSRRRAATSRVVTT